MRTFEIDSNAGFRNIRKNELKDIILRPQTIFYGINGSGKSTIVEMFEAGDLISFKGEAESPEVFSFSPSWIENNVGEFVKGGEASTVLTVRLGEGAGDIETELKEKRKAEKIAQEEVNETEKTIKEAENAREQVVENVVNGIRSKLEGKCEQLKRRTFNKPKIREFLQKSDCECLSEEALQKQLAIANSRTLGPLRMPSNFETWASTSEFREILSRKIKSDSGLVVDAWVREGFENHEPGQHCRFCDGVVSAKRLEDLKNALRDSECQIDDQVKSAAQKIETSIEELKGIKYQVDEVQLEESDNSDSFELIKRNLLEAIIKEIDYLDYWREAVNTRLENPGIDITLNDPARQVEALSTAFNSFRKEIERINQDRQNLTNRRNNAVGKLRSHCCAVDGHDWADAEKAYHEANKLKEKKSEALQSLRSDIQELEMRTSSTADTAKFISDGLKQVLGYTSLSVTQTKGQNAYEMRRSGATAENMSEGEKKLVALLYFCATLRSIENSKRLSNSIVIFDDLVSEFDEGRQYAVMRFVKQVFAKMALGSRPVSVCYFSHSALFLRRKLRDISYKKEDPSNKESESVPADAFYEVYKTVGQFGAGGTSRIREIPGIVKKCQSDYDLALNNMFTAVDNVLLGSGDPTAELDTALGNYCRKALEVFSGFKNPGEMDFGKRVDVMMQKCQFDSQVNYALNWLVNESSHASIDKLGPIATLTDLRDVLTATLKFMNRFDPDHMEKMAKMTGHKDTWVRFINSWDVKADN